MGSYGFQAQYRRVPTPREGNLVKSEWLTATYRTFPSRFDSLIIALGTAYKMSTSKDYSAAPVIVTLRRQETVRGESLSARCPVRHDRIPTTQAGYCRLVQAVVSATAT